MDAEFSNSLYPFTVTANHYRVQNQIAHYCAGACRTMFIFTEYWKQYIELLDLMRVNTICAGQKSFYSPTK